MKVATPKGTLNLDGHSLTLEDVQVVADCQAEGAPETLVALSDLAVEQLKDSRDIVELFAAPGSGIRHHHWVRQVQGCLHRP